MLVSLAIHMQQLLPLPQLSPMLSSLLSLKLKLLPPTSLSQSPSVDTRLSLETMEILRELSMRSLDLFLLQLLTHKKTPMEDPSLSELALSSPTLLPKEMPRLTLLSCTEVMVSPLLEPMDIHMLLLLWPQLSLMLSSPLSSRLKLLPPTSLSQLLSVDTRLSLETMEILRELSMRFPDLSLLQLLTHKKMQELLLLSELVLSSPTLLPREMLRLIQLFCTEPMDMLDTHTSAQLILMDTTDTHMGVMHTMVK